MLINFKKDLIPIEELQIVHGVKLPIRLKFRQLIVTGPPGSGKSNMIGSIRGWPNEGYIDLTQKDWWRVKSLTYRPREVHLGLPFIGFDEALTVFDKEWLEASEPPVLEPYRIKIPPATSGLFQTSWREKYVFEFLLPSPETIFSFRKKRQLEGYFPADEGITLETIQRQVETYMAVILYFHREKMQFYIREPLEGTPMRIADPSEKQPPRWATSEYEEEAILFSPAGLLERLFRRGPTKWMTPGKDSQDITEESRVSYDGKSFELQVGEQTLYVCPEWPHGVRRKHLIKDWIVTDRPAADSGVRGHQRLKVDDTVIIGRSNNSWDLMFDFNKSVKKRHLSIFNLNGDLILTPLDPEAKTSISRIDDGKQREPLDDNRVEILKKIKDVYGGPIEALPADEAMECLQKVNAILLDEPYRTQDGNGDFGALLELPRDKTPIIVGDLHAQIDNLLVVLSEGGIFAAMENDTAYMVILGDAVHSEITGEMEDMKTSALIMDLLVKLKLRFPANLFYLRGNHDSFSEDLSKHGISQGVLMRKHLQETRGEGYVREMQRFYDLVPYVAIAENFLTCHAAPPRKEVTFDEVIALGRNPKLAQEVVTNRFKQVNYPSGYSKGNVKRFRNSLGLPKKTPMIVGHSPVAPHGTIWVNAGKIKGHHVVFSGRRSGPGLMIGVGRRMAPVVYPAEPLLEFINRMK